VDAEYEMENENWQMIAFMGSTSLVLVPGCETKRNRSGAVAIAAVVRVHPRNLKIAGLIRSEMRVVSCEPHHTLTPCCRQ
jgi:hypothetical protein